MCLQPLKTYTGTTVMSTSENFPSHIHISYPLGLAVSERGDAVVSDWKSNRLLWLGTDGFPKVLTSYRSLPIYFLYCAAKMLILSKHGGQFCWNLTFEKHFSPPSGLPVMASQIFPGNAAYACVLIDVRHGTILKGQHPALFQISLCHLPTTCTVSSRQHIRVSC